MGLLTINVRFAASRRLVPLLGDGGEVLLELFERLGFEAEEAFAAGWGAADDAGAVKDAEVLGDGLAGELGIVGELGDGSGLAGAESGNQGEAGLVTEGGEDAGLGFWLGCDALTDFAGHGF